MFTIQAGLLTIFPGSYENFHNIQASWWFFAGAYTFCALIFVILYRDVKKEPTRKKVVEGEKEQVESEKSAESPEKAL